MYLEVKLVAGHNSVRVLDRHGRWTGKYQRGKCWIIFLDENPPRLILVPEFAVEGDIEAGDRDVLVKVKDCGWRREWEQAEWKRLMQAGVFG